MSRELIAIETGIAAGAVAMIGRTMGSLREGPAIVVIAALAAGVFGLAATRICKNEGESLDRRDLVIVGGAALVGAAAGEAIASPVAIKAIERAIDSMGCAFIRAFFGNMFFPLPFQFIFHLASRHVYSHP